MNFDSVKTHSMASKPLLSSVALATNLNFKCVQHKRAKQGGMRAGKALRRACVAAADCAAATALSGDPENRVNTDKSTDTLPLGVLGIALRVVLW